MMMFPQCPGIRLLLVVISAASLRLTLGHSNASVVTLLHVTVMFSGMPPLFMRSASWHDATASMQRTFVAAMSRGAAAGSVPGAEQPVLVNKFELSLKFATQAQTSALDTALDKRLLLSKESGKGRVLRLSAEKMAEEYSAGLMSPPSADDRAKRTTMFLVYNPTRRSRVVDYGYTADMSSSSAYVDVFGFSRSERFAFIDVAAMPFDTQDFELLRPGTPGEILTTLSRDVSDYGCHLGSIIRDILAPPLSPSSMLLFPSDRHIVFKVLMIDVDKSASTDHSPTVKPSLSVGWTFQAERFKLLVESILHAAPLGRRSFSVEIETADDIVTKMAVSRAVRQTRDAVVLDPDALLRDLVTRSARSNRDGDDEDIDHPAGKLPSDSTQAFSFYTDSSYVLHVPIILLSFAERGHELSLVNSEQVRAKAVGRQAIVLAENRLQSKDDFFDLTSLAAKEALVLLSGLDSNMLKQADMTEVKAPLLLIDAAQRNILHHHLLWSRKSAVEPAENALNFDGFDPASIPHSPGTPLDASRRATKEKLDETLASWHQATMTMEAGVGVAAATRALSQAVADLRKDLNAEFCKLSLPNDLALDTRTGPHRTRSHAGLWKIVILPFLAGSISVAVASTLMLRSRGRGVFSEGRTNSRSPVNQQGGPLIGEIAFNAISPLRAPALFTRRRRD
jgi:hypothetical protein